MSNTFIKFIFFLSFTKLLLLCSFFPFYLTLYLSQDPNTFTKFIFFYPYLFLNMMHHKNIMVQESIPLPCWIYMFLFPHFTLSYLCLADGLCFVYLQQGEEPSNRGAWFFHTFSVKVVKILSLMSFFALYRFLVSAVRLSGLGYSHAIISLFYCTFLMKYPYCSKKSWLF